MALLVVGLLAVLMTVFSATSAFAQAVSRLGTTPKDAWACPLSHPIKGNFTTYSGERCIYHVSGGGFYDKTKPERCYATEADARMDGCRRSKR